MYSPMLHHQSDWWSLSLHDGLHNANVAFQCYGWSEGLERSPKPGQEFELKFGFQGR
jgi:hypothetical protein